MATHPRYRDRHGRLWEDRDGPLLIGPGGPQGTDYVTMQAIHHAYGPLEPVDNDGRQVDDEGAYPDEGRGFEIRVSPDRRRTAIYDPGNAPWFVPADKGWFVRTHELDDAEWVSYVPATDRDQALQIVADWVDTAARTAVTDIDDLIWELKQAGYTLPDPTEHPKEN